MPLGNKMENGDDENAGDLAVGHLPHRRNAAVLGCQYLNLFRASIYIAQIEIPFCTDVCY
jgi:hypothetical protein